MIARRWRRPHPPLHHRRRHDDLKYFTADDVETHVSTHRGSAHTCHDVSRRLLPLNRDASVWFFNDVSGRMVQHLTAGVYRKLTKVDNEGSGHARLAARSRKGNDNWWSTKSKCRLLTCYWQTTTRVFRQLFSACADHTRQWLKRKQGAYSLRLPLPRHGNVKRVMEKDHCRKGTLKMREQKIK